MDNPHTVTTPCPRAPAVLTIAASKFYSLGLQGHKYIREVNVKTCSNIDPELALVQEVEFSSSLDNFSD